MALRAQTRWRALPGMAERQRRSAHVAQSNRAEREVPGTGRSIQGTKRKFVHRRRRNRHVRGRGHKLFEIATAYAGSTPFRGAPEENPSVDLCVRPDVRER